MQWPLNGASPRSLINPTMTDYYTSYSYTQFYAQTDRYGLFGGIVVAVIAHHHDDDESLRDAVDDLEGGDNEAFDAHDLIKDQKSKGRLSYGVGDTFSEAALKADKEYWRWYATEIT